MATWNFTTKPWMLGFWGEIGLGNPIFLLRVKRMQTTLPSLDFDLLRLQEEQASGKNITKSTLKMLI